MMSDDDTITTTKRMMTKFCLPCLSDVSGMGSRLLHLLYRR
jgi:hypothetical protein